MTIQCEVPGCTRTFESQGALGPHYGKHRRDGDAGVPAVKYPPKRHKKKNGKRHLPAVRSKTPAVPKADAIGPFTPRDVVEMGLVMMYRNNVPTEDVYEVTQWVNHTEALATKALGH